MSGAVLGPAGCARAANAALTSLPAFAPESRAPGRAAASAGGAHAATAVVHHRQRSFRCQASSSSGASTPELGQQAGAGHEEAKKSLVWSTATVVENKAESVDGTLRTLVLSVEDHVEFLEGRKMGRRQGAPRWIDAYTVPGQYVGIRYPIDGAHSQTGPLQAARQLYAIASSPYQAKSESADLDASIIEVLVDRHGCEDDQRLAELGPGSLAEVSQVVGRGYGLPFNTEMGLLSAMEEGRDLLLIGMGARGISPLRAALQWTPIQAHATTKSITLFYMTDSNTAAAYVKEWDLWREAGIRVNPVYLAELNGNGPSIGTGSSNGCKNKQVMKDALEEAIFGSEAGLAATMGGNPRECAVLLSGLPGDVAAGVKRRLGIEGVAKERILFCDFF